MKNLAVNPYTSKMARPICSPRKIYAYYNRPKRDVIYSYTLPLSRIVLISMYRIEI